MDSKLQLLLEKIDLNKEYYIKFTSAKLIKIVGNKEKDSYIFYIKCLATLDIDTYKTFIPLSPRFLTI